ncbi:hypothetical protein [uncultured Agrobacterium sp.]|uniref:hypothetical protein n=1 Tax=uncultured Agrobacterium sp. TaxID=157277 RepID=UPI00258B975B|nr:hypothetical protein [uncultured Agrobacterium sp.]
MAPLLKAAQIFRDFVTNGVPSSGKWKPQKSDLRTWGTDLEERAGKFVFQSRPDAISESIPDLIQSFQIRGYASPDDGGVALYTRLDAAPVPVKPWHLQTADGSWWKLTEQSVSPQMFGAKGDGVTNDAPAFQAALDYGGSVFLPVPKVSYLLTSPILASVPVKVVSLGRFDIVQDTAGVPAIICATDRFDFDADVRFVSSKAKTGSASSGPYRVGIVYHCAILQVSGNDFRVNGISTYNFTGGVGYHGTQTGGDALASRASITNCFFDKYDFGILGRQFDGMDLYHLTGRLCEQTVEPGHIVYITDRGVLRSRGLRIGSVYDLDNTTAETIKVRNVEGFDIDASVSEECVRGISIGFSRLGVIRGGTIKMSLTALGDTQQNGIVIDDCEEVTFVAPVVDCGPVANGTGYGIRVRTDLGTFGNRSITFIRPTVIVNWTTASAISFSPYFMQGNADVTFIQPKFINRGDQTPSWPFRVDAGSSNVKIIDPEIITSAVANQTRVIRNRPGALNTRVSFDRALAQGYAPAYVVDEAGTCIVDRPDKWEVIAHSAVAVPMTGSTAETTLATITVPARSMGANGKLRITTMWSFTGTGAKTSRVRFGGNNIQGVGVTTSLNARYLCEVENRNAENAQVAAQGNFAGIGSGGGAALTLAVDTTTDTAILLQGTLATASESITLESYTVELCRMP